MSSAADRGASFIVYLRPHDDRPWRVYLLKGSLSLEQVQFIGHYLLADPVREEAVVVPEGESSPQPGAAHWFDVALHGSLADLEGDTLRWLIRELGIQGIDVARSGRRLLVDAPISLSHGAVPPDLHDLLNPVVDVYVADASAATWPAPLPEEQGEPPDDEQVPVLHLDRNGLLALNNSRGLALSLEELTTIQSFFRQLGRNPTETELETLAQTWSEHCSHKTFKARITYRDLTDPSGDGAVTIDSLFHNFIARATREVKRNWIVSAFEDNAGTVRWTPHWDISVKVETHNHPSAVEPFGGASTGVGGVLRDILGVSAQPIASLDVLAFGSLRAKANYLGRGVLHPRTIFRGVVRGIADYGNKVGVPTVAGSVFFHPSYNFNPLVYCGAVGIAPAGSHPRHPRQGDLVVLVGGSTGKDGLRGATFSSLELSGTDDLGSVQVGDPVVERKVMEFVLRARDERLYHAVTDCGAGGLSSAVGEMGASLGVHVDLDRVPLKQLGMKPWQIWLSESQERMVLAVPPEAMERLKAIAAEEQVDISCIGMFTGDGQLRVTSRGRTVADLPMAFLHHGRPPLSLEAYWQGPKSHPMPEIHDLQGSLLALLRHPNIASKDAIIRRYDFEVQGRTSVKPFVGPGDGPADGVVLALGRQGLALGTGFNPLYGMLDPLSMAWAAVDEALRNVVAAGGDPDRTAVVDNFCWGNPKDPALLGSLVRCAQGCYEASLHYRLPFISGKDSLYNEYVDAQGRRIPVPGSLLVTAVAWVPDLKRTVTPALKAPGNVLYVVGETANELGGSHLALLSDSLGHSPPGPPRYGRRIARALHRAIRRDLVAACHDVSEGGMAVALAEMAIAGQLGIEAHLDAIPWRGNGKCALSAMFAESLARYLIEVPQDKAEQLETLLGRLPFAAIGRVTSQDIFRLMWEGKPVVDIPLNELVKAWRQGPSPW